MAFLYFVLCEDKGTDNKDLFVCCSKAEADYRAHQQRQYWDSVYVVPLNKSQVRSVINQDFVDI